LAVYIDKEEFEFSKGKRILEYIDDKKKEIVAIKIDNELKDIDTEIKDKDEVEIVKIDSKEGLDILRHSTAHVLAYAVTKLFKKAIPTIGPSIENGFYYDFDQKFKEEDFSKIEKEMYKIVKEKLPFIRQELSVDEAKKLFKNNKFKIEIINDLVKEEKVKTVSIYKLGDFVDLCRGPHVPDTTYIKAYKIDKLAGAYWKGNSDNEMLSRIYGFAFASKEDLKAYLQMLEEAKKRDHKLLGKQLDLFSFHEEGPGFPFFHPKGTIIWNTLVDFMRSEMMKRNYQENKTPIILNKDLWLKSGHWDHYKENMYFTLIDNKEFAVKPMNCPGNLLVYKTHLHSYKELPIRVGEFGLVHRHEMSGVLNGLFRVRVFTQDDAHIFCTEEQLEDEIIGVIDFIDFIYKTFGYTYNVELSTKPSKAIGSQEIWDKAEQALKNALEKKKMDYKLNEGDGAFYGPKIDYHLKDSIGRTWQCGTIQLDFSMPERFELEYDGADGKKHRPVMLHRAIYGSIERFLGMLIEHYEAKFPLWLSPEQIRVLPVAHAFDDYALEIAEKLKKKYRVSYDVSDDTLSKKIRNAEKQKINYVIVVGEKEQKDKAITIRKRGSRDLISSTIKDFEKILDKEIAEKSLESHLN